jgi:hypothetical protein
MTSESFAAFSKNDFNGKPITSILSGTNVEDKNAFFRKFLIRKITNLLEATKYQADVTAIVPPVPDAVAAATELVRRADTEAFEPGFYIKTAKSIDKIETVLNSCTVEKNPTKAGEVKNIRKIFEMISRISLVPSTSNPFDELIIQLERDSKILITRGDQGVIIGRPRTSGLTRFPASTTIVGVYDGPDTDVNIMETILTFLSTKFQSIVPSDTTLYDGKVTNTREAYSRLALAELKKKPIFDKLNWSALDDAFFQDTLSRRTNLNFVILDEKTSQIKPMTNRIAEVDTFLIFKRSDGKYFPVRLGDDATTQVAPLFGGNLQYIPRQVTGGWHRRTVGWQRSKPSRLTRRKI